MSALSKAGQSGRTSNISGGTAEPGERNSFLKRSSPTVSVKLILCMFLTTYSRYNYLLTPWCRILFEKLIVTQLIKKNPAFLMEPEASSPCPQKPATGPYPEPAESSSPHRSLSP
jgi:hypothetical protein